MHRRTWTRRTSWVGVVGACLLATAVPAAASLRYFDTDRLEQGQSHSITLKLQANGTYMVVAIASGGGIDFDLTVFDPDGNSIVASSSTDENTDWVRFTAPKEGDYKVKVTAYKGAGWYELCLFDTSHY